MGDDDGPVWASATEHERAMRPGDPKPDISPIPFAVPTCVARPPHGHEQRLRRCEWLVRKWVQDPANLYALVERDG